MRAVDSSIIRTQKLWNASRRAENGGDLSGALEIHKQILIGDKASYASCLRAGWLYYKLGSYEESLRYYERASVLSSDAWPLYGIMNCLNALGEAEEAGRVAECILKTGGRAVPAL